MPTTPGTSTPIFVLQGFAREAKSRGAQIITGARATTIARGGEGWTELLHPGRRVHWNLIYAAGAWVDEIASLAGIRRLGFTPNRRSMARFLAGMT